MKTARDEMQKIKLADIILAPDNPRGEVDTKAPAFLEMVEGVRAHGILEPALGRPHPKKKGKVELWAGARRLAAAKAAGCKTLPMLVWAMTDQQAVEIRAVENMDQEHLEPLQEAESVRQMMEVYGGDAEAVAARLGRPRSFVNRRARLGHLTPAWKKFVQDGEHPTTIAHLELIAGFPPEVQDALHVEFTTSYTRVLQPHLFREFKARVAERTFSMAAMPWKKDDDTLHPAAGACSACPKRSSCVPDLFDPEHTKTTSADRCLDQQCYSAKLAAHLARRKEALREEHPDLISVTSEHINDLPVNVLRPHQYDVVKKGTPNARAALVEAGPKAGQVIYVAPLAEHEAGDERGGGRKPAAEMTLEEKRSRLERRRWALVIDELREALGEPGDVPAQAEYADAEGLLRLVSVFSTSDLSFERPENDGAELARLRADPGAALKVVWAMVAPRLRNRLAIQSPTEVDAGRIALAGIVAGLLGLDVAAMKATADTTIPEPKGWAKHERI